MDLIEIKRFGVSFNVVDTPLNVVFWKDNYLKWWEQSTFDCIEYFMYVDGDLYFGDKIKIEKALNEEPHYNFFIYNLKKDKEVYTKLAIVE